MYYNYLQLLKTNATNNTYLFDILDSGSVIIVMTGFNYISDFMYVAICLFNFVSGKVISISVYRIVKYIQTSYTVSSYVLVVVDIYSKHTNTHKYCYPGQSNFNKPGTD